MFVVAMVDLRSTLEVEAAALSKDLGNIAYEARLALSGGMPALLLRTIHSEQARALVASIAARGNIAVMCNADEVVPSTQMVALKKFRIDPEALVLESGETLPFASVGAILRATHRTQSETTSEVKKTAFSAGRALLSGGVMMTKTTTSSSRTASNEREQVLYLFRIDEQKPWILRESSANYTALGAQMGVSRFENFTRMLALLRAKIPAAVYDERLLTAKRVPETLSSQGTTAARTSATSSEAGVDLLAHLVFMSLGPGRAAAYRD